MGNNTFIRGLWGDGPETGNETKTLPKILVDIDKCLKISPQPQPLHVYAWGKVNAHFLATKGIDSFVMSDDGIENFIGATERDYKANGIVNWGTGIWRHKLEALKTALQTFDAIIWLDWDCHQVVDKLPEDFWDRFADGPEFQGSLRRYTRPQCFWRAKRADKRYLVHGAFMYCRSLPFIERTIKWCHEYFPTVNEEIPLSYAVDQLTDGWQGADHWKEAGFEPYCYDQRKKWVHRPTEVLFLNRGRF